MGGCHLSQQLANRYVAAFRIILRREVRGGKVHAIHGRSAAIGLVGMSTCLPRGIRRSAS